MRQHQPNECIVPTEIWNVAGVSSYPYDRCRENIQNYQAAIGEQENAKSTQDKRDRENDSPEDAHGRIIAARVLHFDRLSARDRAATGILPVHEAGTRSLL